MLVGMSLWSSSIKNQFDALVHELKTSQSLPKSALTVIAIQAMNWLPEFLPLPKGKYLQIDGEVFYSAMVGWSALDLAKRVCDCRKREETDITNKRVSQAYVGSAAALFVLYGLGQIKYARCLSLGLTALAGLYLSYRAYQLIASASADFRKNVDGCVEPSSNGNVESSRTIDPRSTGGIGRKVHLLRQYSKGWRA